MTLRPRFVIVTGAPGVGKTEVARRLLRRFGVPSAHVDTDWIAHVWPWAENPALYRLIGRNLGPVIDGYRQHGAAVVIVSGVILPHRVLPFLLPALGARPYDLAFYGLRAGQDTIAARVRGFPGAQEAEQRIAMANLDAEISGLAGVREIHTDDLNVDQVVDTICGFEASDGMTMTAPRSAS